MIANYCDIADVKATLPDTDWGTAYDALLARLVTAASRAIDRFTRRPDGAYAVETDTVRYLDGDGTARLWVGELAQPPTSVAMAFGGLVGAADYVTLATTDYRVWPGEAVDEGRPILRLDLDTLNGQYTVWEPYPRSVRVEGRFGYSVEPPAEIEHATIVQAARYFKRASQAYQDTGAVIELGQLRYVKQLDPDLVLLIQHYRRTVV